MTQRRPSGDPDAIVRWGEGDTWTSRVVGRDIDGWRWYSCLDAMRQCEAALGALGPVSWWPAPAMNLNWRYPERTYVGWVER